MSTEKPTANTPPAIDLRALRKYLNIIESPKQENRKLVIAIGVLGVAVLFQAIVFLQMLPLKERVPYTINVEVGRNGQPTGNVTVSDQVASKWAPDENNIRYFLGRWAENLLTIDEKTKSDRLPSSYALLRGQALDDWQDYVTNVGKPLARLSEKPDLRVRASIVSIAFLSDKSALIRMRLTENKRGEVRLVQITLNFAVLPVTSDDDVYRNPIGLWVTSFGVQNELS